MNKINVLHYIRNLGLGGTEKTCQLFAEHASPQFNVTVAYDINANHPRLSEFEKSMKVCKGDLVGIDPATLKSLLHEKNVDILHVYRSGFSEFPEPGVHVNVPHFVETNVFGLLNPNPNIDKTLFMSQWLMDYALMRLPASSMYPFRRRRFDFVNNPVEDPASFDTLHLDFPDDAIILGRCGRPDNGIYNALHVRAAFNLRSQGYPVCFLVVAPPSNMIDDLAKYDIPFHVIPPTTEPVVLSQFYNTVDIYAHARADGETFGVNIAEAMMHGKPVVTHWAVPSNPQMGVFQSQTELVDHGVTGYVTENDVACYSSALKKLIDDPQLRDSMGKAGMSKARDQYHVKKCVAKLEQIYREVMTNG